jgi:hypothetical protein
VVVFTHALSLNSALLLGVRFGLLAAISAPAFGSSVLWSHELSRRDRRSSRRDRRRAERARDGPPSVQRSPCMQVLITAPFPHRRSSQRSPSSCGRCSRCWPTSGFDGASCVAVTGASTASAGSSPFGHCVTILGMTILALARRPLATVCSAAVP